MKTKEWFKVCKPNPTPEQACVQIGVHLEEVAEMLHELGCNYESVVIDNLADCYKEKHECLVNEIQQVDRVKLLDSLLDQGVTGQGVAHTLFMDYDGGMEEVERSNASKLVDGKPIFDKNGKIDKPESYSKPNLDKFV
jgi:predicted HAD superfamily Cof-like phosphohydrolase